ncbi:hypothetical protein ACUM6W_16725 [Acinetobacter tandoii]|uniref:hypothetical protein n=1 Tax=Acinetobacter tandoii TaxID=202954 RepID=UPI004046358E
MASNPLEFIVETAFKVIRNKINPNYEAEQARRIAEYAKNRIVAFSLTCNCQGLAIPVYGTTHNYLCSKCNRRFANAKHSLNLTAEEYNAGYQLIRNESK